VGSIPLTLKLAPLDYEDELFLKMLMFGTLVVGLPLGVGAQEVKKEKPNLEFGKIQDLEIELVTCPIQLAQGESRSQQLIIKMLRKRPNG